MIVKFKIGSGPAQIREVDLDTRFCSSVRYDKNKADAEDLDGGVVVNFRILVELILNSEYLHP